jgi:hypothetical protein
MRSLTQIQVVVVVVHGRAAGEYQIDDSDVLRGLYLPLWCPLPFSNTLGSLRLHLDIFLIVDHRLQNTAHGLCFPRVAKHYKRAQYTG